MVLKVIDKIPWFIQRVEPILDGAKPGPVGPMAVSSNPGMHSSDATPGMVLK
jgi:hypothetical protein